MLSKKELGSELIQWTRKMIDHKENHVKGAEADLVYGCVFGILVALGKVTGFIQAENQLGYINGVLDEIFNDKPMSDQTGMNHPGVLLN